MAAAPAFESEVGPEAGLLDAVRTETRLASEAEVRRLELVVEWCAAHEVDEEDSATYVEFGRTPAWRWLVRGRGSSRSSRSPSWPPRWG